MTQSLCRGLTALVLLFCSPLGMAQDAAAPQAEPADIERLITTLEDAEARAELVGELRVLLEAADAGVPADTAAQPAAEGDVLALLWSMATDVWQTIISVDPRELLMSLLLSLAIVVAALLLRWLAARLLQRLLHLLMRSAASPVEQAQAEAAGVMPTPEPEAPGESADGRPPLPPTITRLLNLIVGVLAVALIAETWGAGLGELLQTDIGARITSSALAIGVILIGASLLWHISGLLVTRVLGLAGGRGGSERAARRVEALAPLLRSVLHLVIGVLAALLLLSELGINITPLLAGAGILGLAIGFGAQTLVKDLITGVIILLEDSATVGDVVSVAGHIGVVEEMRMRLLQLRDVEGIVHFVPYSEVTTIMNYTKDYSFYLLEVGIAYREDTDEVGAVLTEIVGEMMQEPDYGSEILEPLHILGVDQFADSAVVIKARIKTLPGRQWFVGREFNRRMKYRFDQLGIEIPFPHTTIYFGEPKEGRAPPAQLALTRPGRDTADSDAASG